jgi:hypothetical protein
MSKWMIFSAISSLIVGDLEAVHSTNYTGQKYNEFGSIILHGDALIVLLKVMFERIHSSLYCCLDIFMQNNVFINSF